MSEEVFSTDSSAEQITFKAEIRGRTTITKTSDKAFTLEQVKQWAREAAINNFKVSDADGDSLGSADFPYEGDIVVREYNAAKSI